MYSINYTHQFKKDMRKCAKRGLDIEEIKTAINLLSETGTLPSEYKPHQLKGDHKGQWECHIDNALDIEKYSGDYEKGMNDYIQNHYIDSLIETVAYLSKEDLADMAESLVRMT